jgi:cytochrome b561
MTSADRTTAPDGYTWTQIVLHWTVAVLVVVQLFWHDVVEDAFVGRGAVPELWQAWVHVGIGLTILVLALVRLGLRLWHGAPEPSKPTPPLFVWVGWAAHLALYGFLFAMPLTGALAWFWRIDLSAELHEALAFLLIPLIAAHAAGALVEHMILGNDTLRRMLHPGANGGA